MPTMLIYIIRCKGYLRLMPYLWEVGEKGPYHRCGFIEISNFVLLYWGLLGQVYTHVEPISCQGL